MQNEDTSKKASPGRHVLVVDDESAVGEAIRMMLEHDGHAVQTTESGREALRLLEQENFDLVFTDYSMPEMKGDKLAAAIKQHRPGLAVVMITAHADTLMSSGNPLTGVDFLLTKPFMLADLREAVGRVLQRTGDLHAVEFISTQSGGALAEF